MEEPEKVHLAIKEKPILDLSESSLNRMLMPAKVSRVGGNSLCIEPEKAVIKQANLSYSVTNKQYKEFFKEGEGRRD